MGDCVGTGPPVPPESALLLWGQAPVAGLNLKKS